MTSRYDFMSESNVKDTDGEAFPDPLSVTYNDVQLTEIPKHVQMTSADLEKLWSWMYDMYGITYLDDILLNINNVPYIGTMRPGDVLFLIKASDLSKFATQKLPGTDEE